MGQDVPGLILAAQSISPSRCAAPLELRIDVDHRPEEIDAELETLYHRLNSPGSPSYDSATIDSGLPDLAFRCREADGEYYVYVEDVRRRRLAGYTVFNRLVELRRIGIEKFVRAPHSKYAPEYRRRGIATAIYECALDSGLCLVSGARQSTGAHALWHALAKRHALAFVDIRNKALRYLGCRVDASTLDDLHTRMILLGNGWDIDRMIAETLPAEERLPALISFGTQPAGGSSGISG